MPYIYIHINKHTETYIYKFKWIIRKLRKYSNIPSLQLQTPTSRTHRIITIIHTSLHLQKHLKTYYYKGRRWRLKSTHPLWFKSPMVSCFTSMRVFMWHQFFFQDNYPPLVVKAMWLEARKRSPKLQAMLWSSAKRP